MFSKALIVAINDYQGNDLKGCLADANDLYKTMVSSIGYDPKRIRFLANELATRDNILKKVKWLSDSDHAFFFYAGHGSRTPDNRPTLVSYDYQQHWADPITADDLGMAIGAMRGIIIYDCCHSGSLCAPRGNNVNSLLSRDRTIFDPNYCRERFLPNPEIMPDINSAGTAQTIEPPQAEPKSDLHLGQSPFVYISGCRDSESAKEIRVDGHPRGIFSYTLCRLFRENPKMSIKDLWEKSTREIDIFLASLLIRPGDQHPQLWCREDQLEMDLLGTIS